MLLDDLVFAREHRGPIDFYVFDFEAEFLGALEIVVNVRVVQENFGGNAADVQASAAEKGIFFDDGGFQAPLRGADGGDVAARSAADDHEIVFSQTSPPLDFLGSQTYWMLGRKIQIVALPGAQKLILSADFCRRNRGARGTAAIEFRDAASKESGFHVPRFKVWS